MRDAVKQLKTFCKNNGLEQKAIDAFWQSFQQYREDYPAEFKLYFKEGDRGKLRVEVKHVALQLGDWPQAGSEYVNLMIPIVYGGKELGEYRIWYRLDATAADDMFLIY